MTADDAGRDQEKNRDPQKRQNADPGMGSWSESTYLGKTRTTAGTQDRTMDSPGGEAFADPTRRFGEREKPSEGGPFYEDARRRSRRRAYREDEYGRRGEYGRGVTYGSHMGNPVERAGYELQPGIDFPGSRYDYGRVREYDRDRDDDRDLAHERFARDYGTEDRRRWEADDFDREPGAWREHPRPGRSYFEEFRESAARRSRPQGWWSDVEERQRQFEAMARQRGVAGRGFYGPTQMEGTFYDPIGYARMHSERSGMPYGSMTYGPTYGMTGWEHAGAYGGEYPRRGKGRRTRWEREELMAGEIMTKDVKAATGNDTLEAVARIMKDENCGIVPVVDENRRLIGVVTDRDTVIRALAEGRPVNQVKVSEVMTGDVEAVTPDTGVSEVTELMGRKQVRRVPVVDRRDRLAGIISMADIANRADYDQELQDSLERISARRSFWKLMQ